MVAKGAKEVEFVLEGVLATEEAFLERGHWCHGTTSIKFPFLTVCCIGSMICIICIICCIGGGEVRTEKGELLLGGGVQWGAIHDFLVHE